MEKKDVLSIKVVCHFVYSMTLWHDTILWAFIVKFMASALPAASVLFMSVLSVLVDWWKAPLQVKVTETWRVQPPRSRNVIIIVFMSLSQKPSAVPYLVWTGAKPPRWAPLPSAGSGTASTEWLHCWSRGLVTEPLCTSITLSRETHTADSSAGLPCLVFSQGWTSDSWTTLLPDEFSLQLPGS